MAAQQPQRIAAVILNDIGPEVSPAGLARIAGYVGKLAVVTTWQEAALQCREVYGQALPDFTHDDWLAFARLGYREDASGVPRLDMDPAIGTAMRESAASPSDLWGVFEALKGIPTLLLRGALSDILDEGICNEMLRRKPDLRRVTIPRRGHPPMLDEPESLAAIDAFLGDL
jgi:pimeloyl-ACP methyl ester carboxylesterase